jgi:hypothetical protein
MPDDIILREGWKENNLPLVQERCADLYEQAPLELLELQEAFIYLNKEDYAAACTKLDQVATRIQGQPSASDEAGDSALASSLLQGYVQHRLKEPWLAAYTLLETCRPLLAQEPRDPYLSLLIAGAELEQDRWAEAFTHAYFGFCAAPRHPLARRFHALLLSKQLQRVEDAEERDALRTRALGLSQEALRSNPKDVDLAKLLLVLGAGQGRPDLVAQALEYLKSSDDPLPFSLIYLALSKAAEEGLWQKGEALLDVAESWALDEVRFKGLKDQFYRKQQEG